ncbi:MAG: DUF2141 domain-containing protein [Treponema sp.]|nr:DUF2141 domain-containing protein [Treponema sp.]
MKKIILVILALMVMGYASAETLTVQVENVEVGKGLVLIGLYNNEKAFPEPDRYYTSAKAEPTDKVVTITIPDLPKGVYVAAIYQDKNGNDKMDKNLLGIPTERYGFSNNTMLPDWKKNSFELNADTSIMIKLR